MLASGETRDAQIEFSMVSALDHTSNDRVARALIGLTECALKLPDTDSRQNAKLWLQAITDQFGATPSVLPSQGTRQESLNAYIPLLTWVQPRADPRSPTPPSRNSLRMDNQQIRSRVTTLFTSLVPYACAGMFLLSNTASALQETAADAPAKDDGLSVGGLIADSGPFGWAIILLSVVAFGHDHRELPGAEAGQAGHRQS